MNVIIQKSRAAGNITAPPSKSQTHRMLICAALANGVSRIRNVQMSDDIQATLGCIRALGVQADVQDGCVVVHGGNISPVSKLWCGESGSTLRFMIPVAMLSDSPVTLAGTQRLLARSLDVYNEAGLNLDIGIQDVTVKGPLEGGTYRVRGDVSSQFITGLMLALVPTGKDSKIIIEGKLESKPYIDITADVMEMFGVRVERQSGTIRIPGGQSYTPIDATVEGDMSNCAFFDALCRLGGDVKISGINENTLQGDRVYRQYFEKIESGFCELDVSNCPDLAPVLMALGAAKNGVRLSSTARLKIKESDRGAAMKAELEKFGAHVLLEDDSITVNGKIHTPDCELCGHNDHRIVMALAVLCTLTGGKITCAQAVNKSLPDFFERLGKLGVKYEIE